MSAGAKNSMGELHNFFYDQFFLYHDLSVYLLQNGNTIRNCG